MECNLIFYRKNCLSVFFIFVAMSIWGQTPCKDCACIYEKVEDAVKRENYEELLRLYNAVKECDPKRIPSLDARIEVLFQKAQKIHLSIQKNVELALHEEKNAKKQAQNAKNAEFIAQELNKKAEDNSKKLKEVSLQISTMLLKEAEDHILYLQYNSALEKIYLAINFYNYNHCCPVKLKIISELR
jgi:hypothetical protein